MDEELDESSTPVEEAAPEAPERGAPDLLYIVCPACWQPRDTGRPVMRRQDWEEDGQRFRTFYCRTCSVTNGVPTEMTPSLIGLWLEDGIFVQEGTYAPISTEVDMVA